MLARFSARKVKKFVNTVLLGPRATAVCFFVRVPLRNALVTRVSTQKRAGIGDLRARQSQEQSLLHGLPRWQQNAANFYVGLANCIIRWPAVSAAASYQQAPIPHVCVFVAAERGEDGMMRQASLSTMQI